MKGDRALLSRMTFALALLCEISVVGIMVALPIYKQQVFLDKGNLTTGGEMGILIAFVCVLVFHLVSLLWLLSLPAGVPRWLLVLGALCLLLLLGEKVMVDEIAREYSLHWEVTGEWVILYVFLTIQWLYSVMILRPAGRASGGA